MADLAVKKPVPALSDTFLSRGENNFPGELASLPLSTLSENRLCALSGLAPGMFHRPKWLKPYRTLRNGRSSQPGCGRLSAIAVLGIRRTAWQYLQRQTIICVARCPPKSDSPCVGDQDIDCQ